MALTAPTRRRVVTTLTATFASALAGAVAVPSYARAAERKPGHSPLRRAHAHNDYEHPRPLLDALSHGFTSVEADVYLVDGRLLVAHDPVDLDPSRTLESLYLAPLAARIEANHGSVYRGHRRPVQLLIDIKTDGAATYPELHRQLRRYRRMLSTYAHGHVRPGAVTPVVSGDRAARAPMEAQRVRHAFYDGRLGDLGDLDGLGAAAPALASFIPLISSNWTHSFAWQGVGPFPAAERANLHAIVSTAHRRGQRVRFWATPDLPGPARDAVWTELLAADVDHVNTDDLAGLERFLRTHDA